jgi:hypothetical protein
MRRFLVLALLPLAFLSGCGEMAAVAPAKTPEKAPEVKVAEKPAPATVTTPRRVATRKPARGDMIIIPTERLPKGWSYMGEADLRKG